MPKSVFGDAWKAVQDAWQATKDTASGVGDIRGTGSYPFGEVRAARPQGASAAQIEKDKTPPETDLVSAGAEAARKKPTPPPDLEKELQ